MPITPRAVNPINAAGSSGSLLDSSTAKPHSIDMRIFDKKSANGSANGAPIGQGTVNPSYLKECREEDPWPADSSCAPGSAARSRASANVVLSDCRIDTPEEDLATDQPFSMSCEARSQDGNPITGSVCFRLFCITAPDKPPEDTYHTVEGKLKEGHFRAEGTLFSPISRVEWGAPLKYHVVAQHSAAKEKAKSADVGVEAYVPPKPVAIWVLSDEHFDVRSSFIWLSASEKFSELKKLLESHSDSLLLVLGHCESGGSEDENEELSARIAFALYFLLTIDDIGCQTITSSSGNAEWQSWLWGAITMIGYEEAQSLTYAEILRRYSHLLNAPHLQKESFLGDPSSGHQRLASAGCGSANIHIKKSLEADSVSYSQSFVTVFILPKSVQRTSLRTPCKPWPIFDSMHSKVSHQTSQFVQTISCKEGSDGCRLYKRLIG